MYCAEIFCGAGFLSRRAGAGACCGRPCCGDGRACGCCRRALWREGVLFNSGRDDRGGSGGARRVVTLVRAPEPEDVQVCSTSRM